MAILMNKHYTQTKIIEICKTITSIQPVPVTDSINSSHISYYATFNDGTADQIGVNWYSGEPYAPGQQYCYQREVRSEN